MVTKRSALEFVKTGIDGLDDIFLGGIRSNNVVIVEGAAGTGKTTLGTEFIYRGATEFKENGLLVTFEVTPERLIRDAKGFGWDFNQFKKKRGTVKILHSTPTILLQELISRDSNLSEEIRKLNIKRIFIDGLTPLRNVAEGMSGRSIREGLYVMVENLHRLGVTAIFTREISDEPHDLTPSTEEQFICDTIIKLRNQTSDRSSLRTIEIKKSRGQDYISGEHTLHIEKDRGLRVFKRAQAKPKMLSRQPTSHERQSTGVATLDPIIGGGVYVGSITLVVGISGTGKTVLGTQFLGEGVRLGQKTLMISLDEQPKQIIRNAKTLGIGLEEYFRNGDIMILNESPLELEMDVHFYNITKIIEENKIERVLVDSLSAYQNVSYEESQRFITTLASYLKNHLVTSFFNYESPELLGLSQISEDLKASAIVDNIILLNYVEISTQMRRAITVPKARGSVIPQRTKEFTIEKGGIRLIEEVKSPDIEEVPQLPFSSYYGILSRAPARHSPTIDSRVVRGETLPDGMSLN